MTEKELKEVMGEPEEVSTSPFYPNCRFFFYEGKSLVITYYGPQSSIQSISRFFTDLSWHTSKNIKTGNTLEDVIQAYNLDKEEENVYGNDKFDVCIDLYFIVNSRGKLERLRYPTEKSGKDFELDILRDAYYSIYFASDDELNENDLNIVSTIKITKKDSLDK